MGINMESSRQPTVNSRQLSVYNAFFAWLKAKFEKENPPPSRFRERGGRVIRLEVRGLRNVGMSSSIRFSLSPVPWTLNPVFYSIS
jgi:hypothetical protein